MPKPEREWLTVTELSKRWKNHGISNDEIQSYLWNAELKASILLPRITLTECQVELDRLDFSVEPISDVFTEGLFYISGYKNIVWVKSSEEDYIGDLCNRYVFLSNNNDTTFYYINANSHIIYKKDIIITIEEIERFEEKYINRQTNSESKLSDEYEISERRKNTLYNVIAALLDILLRETPDSRDDKKRKIIKNQSHLIEILEGLNKPGLSRSTLDRLFPEAKRMYDKN